MNEILFASFYLDFIHSGGALCWLCILTFRNTLLYLHFRLSVENLSVKSDCKRWNKFHFRCTFLIIKVSCLGSPVFCEVYALKQKGAVAKVKQHIMQWIMQLPLYSGEWTFTEIPAPPCRWPSVRVSLQSIFQLRISFLTVEAKPACLETYDWWHLVRDYRPHPINRHLSWSWTHD